jgi:hypothetical protein
MMYKNLKIYLNGQIDEIVYKDIVIVCKKNRNNLKPNIAITKDLNIPETIKGNLFIVCKSNNEFKSVSKAQAVEYVLFLKKSSFHYDNLEVSNLDMLKEMNIPLKIVKQNSKKENDETLKMILGIQAVILKFIDGMKN